MNSVKDTATAFGESLHAARISATNKLGEAAVGTEDALHSAAATVRDAGAQGAAVIDDLATGAGKHLASASAYLGRTDAASVSYDMQRMVRRHPGTFVLVAAVLAAGVGYLAGSQTCRTRD